MLTVNAHAQVKTKFQPNYDAKQIRFGYYIGFATTHYDVKHRASFASQTGPNIIYSVTSPNTTSIRAGAMINYYINDYFDVRFSPLNISIIQRAITYRDAVTGDEKRDKMDNKSWLEIPFHVKYKSERRNNSRMYIFAGTRWGFETNIVNLVGGKKSPANYSMRTNDLMLEYGMGLELFREYFKVSPELHFSHGLFNMIPKNYAETHLDHVKNLKTHSVSLLILFQ